MDKERETREESVQNKRESSVIFPGQHSKGVDGERPLWKPWEVADLTGSTLM